MSFHLWNIQDGAQTPLETRTQGEFEWQTMF